MRNIDQPHLRNKSRDLNERGLRQKAQGEYKECGERAQDRQLYDLCQQLTKDNRILNKQVADLRKALKHRDSSGDQQLIGGNEIDQYRRLNYESYKKKAMQMQAAVRFLQKLHIQRSNIEQRNRIIDKFMGKIRTGESNIILELVKLFEEQIKQEQGDGSWDCSLFEKDATQLQNELLRRHIVKLNSVLIESVHSMRGSINQIKQDYMQNRDKIRQEISDCCSRFMGSRADDRQFKGREERQYKGREEREGRTSSQVSSKKGKKSKKSILQDSAVEKASWDRVIAQRSKIKENRYCLQPNVVEHLSQSLAIAANLTNNYTIPLSSKVHPKPPLPRQTPTNPPQRYQRTIVDQLVNSKMTGNSNTPKSSNKESRAHVRDYYDSRQSRQSKERTPNWRSYKDSPNHSYYR